jgi:hypothetical protein
VNSARESALRSEGRETPHRSHAGGHHERIKRRTDKVRRAHDRRVVKAELQTADGGSPAIPRILPDPPQPWTSRD